MVERRLVVAKELLNPAESVLIVTIDEKEYLRLGLLLEQVFPASRVQMVSSVISQKGVARDIGMNRVDEYIFFVFWVVPVCPSLIQFFQAINVQQRERKSGIHF
jgi:adenine-specific DNA-methyltransferase